MRTRGMTTYVLGSEKTAREMLKKRLLEDVKQVGYEPCGEVVFQNCGVVHTTPDGGKVIELKAQVKCTKNPLAGKWLGK